MLNSKKRVSGKCGSLLKLIIAQIASMPFASKISFFFAETFNAEKQ
jgi:hypothetical protein